MKSLAAMLREQGSDKASANAKNDGIMLRRSASTEQTSNIKENEETIKIAKILMKIEDQRNGTA
jgi:hypothetical protein